MAPIARNESVSSVARASRTRARSVVGASSRSTHFRSGTAPSGGGGGGGGTYGTLVSRRDDDGDDDDNDA